MCIIKISKNTVQCIKNIFFTDQNVEFLQPSKSRKKDGYLPQEEDAVRKKLRSEETATRAARQMYVLRQQVRQIQQELTKTGTDKTKHTKKVIKFVHNDNNIYYFKWVTQSAFWMP